MTQQLQHQATGNIDVKISGRARLVTHDDTNKTTKDTGWHGNLELDNGLNALGADNQSWFTALSVGTGNSPPSVQQIQLDSLLAKSTTKTATNNCSVKYDAKKDYYEIYAEHRYDFADIAVDSDVTIREFGLTLADDSLATRTLTKDIDGDVKEFIVKQGDTLSVFYGIAQRFSIADIVSQINVFDGQGGIEPYTVTTRLGLAGQTSAYLMDNIASSLKLVITTASSYYRSKPMALNTPLDKVNLYYYNGESKDNLFISSSWSEYVDNSFERTLTLKAGYDELNLESGIRRVTVGTNMGCWQIQFDRVSDGAALDKTIATKLSIPISFRWGRADIETI